MDADDFLPLDIRQAPLDASALIEASAGTGKTWTITGLYARLILERGLRVEQILVVTYTKAATAELRGRIRARLAELLQAFKHDAGDDFCRQLAAAYPSGLERERAQRRLNHAVQGFDEAAIFTIHGFCQRVLGDSAFESGMDFELTLVPDEHEILVEVVDDFWRREVVAAEGAWAEYLVGKSQSPDQWLAEIRPHLGKPYLQLVPVAGGESAAPEQAFAAAYRAARALWREQGEAIQGLLKDSPALNRNKFRAGSIEKWCRQFDDYFRAESPAGGPPDGVQKLGMERIAGGCKKGKSPPRHDFFERLDDLSEAAGALNAQFAARLSRMKMHLLQWCNEELRTRKAQNRLLSYNDLLNRLDQALTAAGGECLADALRARYPAALIDEFQDTDPIQYRIFQRIYAGTDLPVVFVGDPKQAIYSFRGADLYSYLMARDAVQRHYTLATNQRSVPGLIQAINTLFTPVNQPAPFLESRIGYRAVAASERERDELVIGDEGNEPFRFLLMTAENGEPLNKTDADARATEASAEAIVGLLKLAGQGRARLHGRRERPLTGGDIAVLVPSHRQGRLIQEALALRGVAAVRQGQDNVFASIEAAELERVLRAVAEPAREERVRAALATWLGGRTAADLAALTEDESAWERVLEQFMTYHRLWNEVGFMRMFRAWLDAYQVPERLLAMQGGERRLTNVLHLGELLQLASREKNSIDRLLAWYSRTLRDPETDETALLRLESDADRVKIVTIHTSKGLEYPVVFCPFLWDGRLRPGKEVVLDFHDPAHGGRASLDFGSADFNQNQALADREKLAEKLRLLYVALTRAKHRCYVLWGHVRQDSLATAALAWLLHAPPEAGSDPLAAMKEAVDKLDQAAIEAALESLRQRAPGCIRIDPAPAGLTLLPAAADNAGTALGLTPRQRGRLESAWRIASFSGLSAGRHSEAPDHDADDRETLTMPDDESIFAFPRGAAPGTCMHAVFEEWDFGRRDHVALQALAARKLAAYGIDPRWTAVLARQVAMVLDTPLAGPGSLRLADLPADQRRPELEFTYPVEGLDEYRLRRLLADPVYGLEPAFRQAAQRLAFGRVQGYMKGFIDLVFEADGRFYLLDYKSNWLGPSRADYGPEALTRAMAEAHYYLQYLIYSLALHHYLGLRLPDYDYQRHFGGVYYLFIRGIDSAAADDCGIFRDRPRLDLIEALARLMAGRRDE